MCMKLANRECANNDDNYCVWGDCRCHAVSEAGYCKYFSRWVLPGYPDVEACCYIAREGEDDRPFQICDDCKEPFYPTKPRQVFCEDCAHRRQLELTRERVRKAREKARSVTPENARIAF